MDRNRLRVFFRKVLDAPKSHRSKEFCVFLFFLAVSATFWVLQTLDETLEKTLTVSVQLVDVPEGVVITSPPPEEVRLTVSDKGTALIHYMRYGLKPLTISFADYYTARESGRVLISTADEQKMLQACLLSSTRIRSFAPDTLEFFYNHGLSKTVPVRVAGKVEVSPEYYLLDVKATPAEVTVYGPTAVLDTLSWVSTEQLSLSGVESNTSVEVGLEGMKGVKYNVDRVKVDVEVDVFMENVVTVPIHTANFPATKLLRTFPSEAQVTYTVGYARRESVTDEDFVILFTYEQVLAYQEEGRAKIPLSLRSVPEGVTGVRIEPASVDYLVETFEGEETDSTHTSATTPSTAPHSTAPSKGSAKGSSKGSSSKASSKSDSKSDSKGGTTTEGSTTKDTPSTKRKTRFLRRSTEGKQ